MESQSANIHRNLRIYCLLIMQESDMQESSRFDSQWREVIRKNSNVFVEVACTSFCLGFLAALCVGAVVLFFFGFLSTHSFAFAVYLLTCSILFHSAEFLIAAVKRPHDTHPKAFMIFHSPAFMIANIAAVVEFVVETFFVPDDWKLVSVSTISVALSGLLVVFFYGIRCFAMITCGENFSLEIEVDHREDHTLVTSGIYAWLRHPSYFGWFWRTLFSQVILMNPVCFLGFVVVTWKFFRRRIAEEEKILQSDAFFGEAYRKYQSTTWVGIPFI